MSSEQPPASSPFTTDAWRTTASASWLDHADRLEAMLEPVLGPLFDHAALAPGERVLDVGCGRGVTSQRAARIVGPSGAVTAVDVAENLIEAASAVPTSPGAAPVEWVVADAQRAELPAEHFDAVISRFGVMFFDDPVEAFANLRAAARPGGRLAAATWRPRDASPFQWAGISAVVAALQANGYDAQTGDPAAGPFSFGIDAHVHEVLAAAGWRDVTVHPVELALLFGGPGASPSEAVEVALTMAGCQTFLDPYDDAARAIAADALLDVFTHHHDGTGVRLDAAMTGLTARS